MYHVLRFYLNLLTILFCTTLWADLDPDPNKAKLLESRRIRICNTSWRIYNLNVEAKNLQNIRTLNKCSDGFGQMIDWIIGLSEM